MSSEAEVRAAFARQAVWCERLGSPFTARLMAGLGRRLGRDTVSGRTVLDWQGDPDARGDSVPLRLAGALHALVRRGWLPDLAMYYPPNPLPETEALADAAMQSIARADSEIAAWLAFPPQTNEVARSGVLYPGLRVVAAETGLPLALFEVGASAGLNLISDSFGYRLGRVVAGRANSPVVLSPDWTGAAPQGEAPRIASRRGCDRNPLGVAQAAHRERLVAYVWPDQADRLARVEAAIALAMEDPPLLDAADAADWVEAVIGAKPEPYVTRVLFHSIALQYFPEVTVRRIAARMLVAGAQATRDAPLAWLAFELDPEGGAMLTLRLWPGGGERILAKADAHVRAVRWLG